MKPSSVLAMIAAALVAVAARGQTPAQPSPPPPTYTPPNAPGQPAPTYTPPNAPGQPIPTYTAPHAPPSPYTWEPSSPFYIDADIGGDILQNMNVKNAGAKLNFNPGVRGGATFGYQFLPFLASEFEVASIWNSVKTGDGHFLPPTAQNADLYQIPFLASLVFRIPVADNFSIYFGGGGGGVASDFEVSQFATNRFGFRFYRHTGDTDAAFAYQGETGFKFKVTPFFDVGAGYKFLGTGDHSWFSSSSPLFTRTGPAYSHSFLATFTFRF